MANAKKELTIADMERMARDYGNAACDPCASPASRKWAEENYRKIRSCIEAKKKAARRVTTVNAIVANKNASVARGQSKPIKREGNWKPFDWIEFENQARKYENRAALETSASSRKYYADKAKKMRRVLLAMKKAGWIKTAEEKRDSIEYR